MKRSSITLFIASILVTGFLLSSCENCIEGNGKVTSKYVKVGAFTEVKISGDANLILVADSSDSLRIEGESNIIDAFEFDVVSGTLKIRTEPCIRSQEPVTITLPYKMIEMLTINGSGNINSRSVLQSPDLELVVNGSGNIELEIESDNVVSQINGSGSILLKGTAKAQKTVINGSGNLEAADLASGKVKITINGSGDCKVQAIDALSVTVRGSGNVYYKGSPDISTDIKGSGSVEKSE